MVQSGPDFGAIKQRQQQMWATGDFAEIGAQQVIVGERLCEAVDLRPGSRVLDVACGSGTAALAAARRFGEVTGIDFVPALLERGRERAAAERLMVEFLDGDAEALPFVDASFDVVLSTFGVMFAPDQPRAAAELLRVCRPGGVIGLANWTPGSAVGEKFALTARYMAPPPGLNPPSRWGTDEGLQALQGDGVSELAVKRRDFVFRYRSLDHWLEVFAQSFGPVRRIFETSDAPRRETFTADLFDLLRRHNRSGNETLVMPSAYLEAVAIRR